MTQEIIDMARQAGFGNYVFEARSMFEAFAKLVAAKAASKERERIFDMLHEMHVKAKGRHNYYLHAVVTLREKGEA